MMIQLSKVFAVSILRFNYCVIIPAVDAFLLGYINALQTGNMLVLLIKPDKRSLNLWSLIDCI